MAAHLTKTQRVSASPRSDHERMLRALDDLDEFRKSLDPAFHVDAVKLIREGRDELDERCARWNS